MRTPDHPGTLRFSVVITTFNRAEVLPRAIRSVLEQSMPDLELIVVDDGSTDDTAETIAKIDDPRLRYVAQPNRGFSAGRNAGVALATSDWVAFLDDDDTALPDWLSTLDGLCTDRCGIACCGAALVNQSGKHLKTLRPTPTGPVFDDVVALFLAGTFALRRDAFLAVGGFTEVLECSQQTELFLRLVPYCSANGLEIANTAVPGVRIEQAENADRPSITPERLLRGGAYVVEHHGERLARSREFFANWYSVMGVSACRAHEYSLARKYLARALRADPLSPKRWTRYGLVLVPAMGSRVWRSAEYSGVEIASGVN